MGKSPLTPADIERARQMALDATAPGGALGSITVSIHTRHC